MSGPDDDTIDRDDEPALETAAAAAPVGDIEEEVDEELLALAGPPPSIRHGLFIVAVLALSVFMLSWFYPDLRYLLRAFEGPTHVGDAADLYGDELAANSWIGVDGIPMLTRTLEFKEGIQWFALSDTRRKLFPLGGQSRLLIQWTVPEKHKVYRDPAFDPTRPSLPGAFEGHLYRRGDLGANYEKIWVFYDCLEHYSLRQCKHCIGVGGMDDCRARFTCLEQRSAKECQAIFNAPGGRGLADHPEFAEHLDELALDELKRSTGQLEAHLAERRELVEATRQELEELSSGVLVSKLEETKRVITEKIAQATADEQQARAKLTADYGLKPEQLRTELGDRRDRVNELSSSIEAHKRRAERYKQDLADLAGGSAAAVETRLKEDQLRLTPSTAETKSDAGPPETAPADGGVDAVDAANADRLAELELDRRALADGTLATRRESQIEELKPRIAQLVSDNKAAKTALEQLEKLAQQLKDLPRTVRQRQDKLAELEERQAAVASGELKTEKQELLALLTPRLEQMERAAPALAALRQEITGAQSDQVPALAERLRALEQQIAPPSWILIDGEVPIDKLWVALVWLVFLVMIGINLRRLYHFWLQWRA